jgi:hypothetical protein
MNKLDHVGIATNDIDKYVEIFSAMGGKVVCSAEAKEFEALCVFIEFERRGLWCKIRNVCGI